MKKVVLCASSVFVSSAGIFGCGTDASTEPVVVGVQGAVDRTVDDELRDLGFADAGLPAKRHGNQSTTLYKHADGRRAARLVGDGGLVMAIVFDQKGKPTAVLGARSTAGIRAQDYGALCFALAFSSCYETCVMISVEDGTSDEVCYPGCEYEVFRYCAISGS
jgi:hypothetical protein